MTINQTPIGHTVSRSPLKSDAGNPLFGQRGTVLLALLGLLMAFIIYRALPLFGISSLSEALNLKRLILLAGGLMGTVIYYQYWQFIIPRPQLLTGFVLLAWPLVDYLNMQLLTLGVNVHLRPLLMLAVMAPMGWIAFRERALLWHTLPWLKYYLGFFVWLMLYFIFYNANATDPRLSGGASAMGDGSVSMVQLTAYLYCLLVICVSAVTMLKVKNFRGLFDFFNQALLWISGLEALLTILGYPFGLFCMMLDGFNRAIGIFTHPNPFAHHMGILMVYLLGLFCYYQGERQHRIPTWLLLGGLAINLIAFLLGLSKTALSAFALCGLLVFLMNLAVPAVRSGLIKIVISMLFLLPVGLFAFEALSGQSFFSIIESRIEQTQSLTWRTLIWQDLLAEVNPISVWFGHGFTAANETVFRLTFNDAKNANPLMMVHNAYIALIYDLGVMGYLMFMAALSLIVQSAKNWLAAVRPALRTEHAIIIALTIYFLFVCGVDEMSYMFDAPMLFWSLVSILFCLSVREQAASPKTMETVLP